MMLNDDEKMMMLDVKWCQKHSADRCSEFLLIWHQSDHISGGGIYIGLRDGGNLEQDAGSISLNKCYVAGGIWRPKGSHPKQR